MKLNKKLIAIPALALAAGLSLAACSTSTPTATPTHAPAPATSAPATTPAPTPAAAASPVGTWNVAYTSSPTATFGQYSITQSGGTYTLTTKTALRPPYLNCALPPNTEEGTFTAVGPTTFAGNGKLWTTGTCTYGYMSPIELRFSGGNELILQYSNGGGPLSFTLTRVGSSVSPSPASVATAPPVATAPSPVPVQTTPASAPSSGVGNGNSGNSAAVGNGMNGVDLTRCGLNSNQPQAMVYSIFAGPGTSCPFADNVGDEYGAPGTETVYSPTTGQTYAMNCQPIGPDGAGGHEIRCTGGNDAVVEFDVTS